MERRQAFTNRPAKDMTAARISDELASEKKLRQLAELNIVRPQTHSIARTLADSPLLNRLAFNPRSSTNSRSSRRPLET